MTKEELQDEILISLQREFVGRKNGPVTRALFENMADDLVMRAVKDRVYDGPPLRARVVGSGEQIGFELVEGVAPMEGALGWLATVECMANDVRNRGVEPKFLVVGEHDYMMARFAAAELMGTPERPLDPTEILGLQIVKVYEGRARIGW